MKSANNILNLARSQKAQKPTVEEIAKSVEKANKNAKNNHHRLFLPEPYTR